MATGLADADPAAVTARAREALAALDRSVVGLLPAVAAAGGHPPSAMPAQHRLAQVGVKAESAACAAWRRAGVIPQGSSPSPCTTPTCAQAAADAEFAVAEQRRLLELLRSAAAQLDSTPPVGFGLLGSALRPCQDGRPAALGKLSLR